MIEKRTLLVSFIITTILAIATSTPAFEPPPGSEKYHFSPPNEVISTFLKAVDKQGMMALDHKINKSMLTPVRIEYVYELNGSAPKIKVYSDLKQEIPVREHVNCKIRGISAILDERGDIIQTEAHIWTD